MPDLRDNGNIVEKALEIFSKVQWIEGSPAPDEVSFVGGFLTCFGIITGRVDIGLDEEAPLTKILDNIHKDLSSFGQRIMNRQREMEEWDNRLKRNEDRN